MRIQMYHEKNVFYQYTPWGVGWKKSGARACLAQSLIQATIRPQSYNKEQVFAISIHTCLAHCHVEMKYIYMHVAPSHCKVKNNVPFLCLMITNYHWRVDEKDVLELCSVVSLADLGCMANFNLVITPAVVFFFLSVSTHDQATTFHVYIHSPQNSSIHRHLLHLKITKYSSKRNKPQWKACWMKKKRSSSI